MDMKQIVLFIGLISVFDQLYVSAGLSKHIPRKLPRTMDMFTELPICTSHNTLCHMAMKVTAVLNNNRLGVRDSYSIDRQLCECDGDRKCPTNYTDTQRSMVKPFRSASELIEMRMSYCKMELPARRCKKNEPALTFKGNGPFLLETSDDFLCRCPRVLYEHRSWSKEYYNYIQYSCGKPLCHRMPNSMHGKDVCMTVTNEKPSDSHVPYLVHDYKCRCRYNEDCQVDGNLPENVGDSVDSFCVPQKKNNMRKRSRQNMRDL